MHSANLPFILVASPALRRALGPDLVKVAVMAMRVLLKQRRGVEIALQQIDYRKMPIAFSSRIGRLGDLILELDVGDPSLSGRVFVERELRQAEAEAAGRRRR